MRCGNELICRFWRRKLWEIWLDDAKMVVDPAQRRLIHDVGRDDVIFRVFPSRLHKSRDSRVLEEDLLR